MNLQKLKDRLRPIKWSLIDVRSRLLRNRVAKHAGIEREGLQPYQVYPEGGNLNSHFFAEPRDRFPKIMDDKTPVASMGSCFAVEIESHLRRGNFNFIKKEDSKVGSAEWGRVYTTKNMLQIFQYSLSDFAPEIRYCRDKRGVFDPYREGRFYASEDEAEEGFSRHYHQSREVLLTCEILTLTPGQNEAWISKSDGLAWCHKPPPEAFDTFGRDNFEVKRFTLEENIEFLDSALTLLWDNNPNVKVIFTLSPVPSFATFFDLNVSIRSFENKAILLLAVKEIVKRNPEKTYYFPSFEIAMLSNNLNLQFDNRHVTPRTAKKIMSTFDQCFVIGQE